MSSNRDLLWFAMLGTLLVAGCASSHDCATSESCNERDDDCDGLVDETFRDPQGRYVNGSHCGRCGLSCAEVFPTAAGTACVLEDEVPICKLEVCGPGTHPVGDGVCVPDISAQCLPCTSDADCSARFEGARCLAVDGEQRCAMPCTSNVCPEPFACGVDGLCWPELTLCACHDVSDTFEVACLREGSAPGIFCAGLQSCGPAGLGECMIASVESCNAEDDDCDGLVDEDFVDASGRYVHVLHCGECGKPCVPPGAHFEAVCTPSGATAECNIECADGFVNVDGIEGNGCECQIFDGTTAPVVVGSDSNCDGIVDDDSTFVHVTTGGSDSAPGTLVRPMRSITAAITRARSEGKAVLIAQGSYEGFSIQGGVSVFGGYRSDFRDRNTALYPVQVEHASATDGSPVLRCTDVLDDALVDGITFVGEDSQSTGRGSTALYFDGCDASVKLANVIVLAGRGNDGRPGDDASARLPDGVSSLTELAGHDGREGREGGNTGLCSTLSGGSGGSKSCVGSDVSGGSGGAASCPDIQCEAFEPCANAGCTDFTTNGVCDYQTVLALAVANPRPGTGRGSFPGAAGLQSYNAPTSRGVCSFCDDNPTLNRLGDDGRDGAGGAIGGAGNGCNARTLVLDASGRGAAPGGSAGTSGRDGSGGGGGSAGNGYSVVDGTDSGCSDVPGGSGGGGGSGGCGAPGGGQGGGGGASIGIVVTLPAGGVGPTLTEVRVVTASGGRGGDGGIGAAGGAGGEGAQGGGSSFWCARSGGRGGNGGSGGSGGGGGGGCGGASHALYFVGSPTSGYRNAVNAALTVEAAGVPGLGGRGGFSPGNRGSSGLAGSGSSVGQ